MPGNVRPGGLAASKKPPHAIPTRAMSLDSLHDKKANVNLDQKIQEYLPTRISRAAPKSNPAAMQFVKTGPASLYKSATEQIKKAEEVKELRKTLVNEEAEWQEQPPSSSSKSALDEGSDWQSNLDKWKSSRRKRLQTTVDSIIQIKKNEEEEEMNRMRRKSKTFSQIQEDKTKRGRKYNLTVHNDDDNDLSSLGLTPSKSNGSIADTQEDQDTKDLLDQDNKDAKSDAGFCTGSDTGSDGVFAEDNISDTSSALGDKKEAHDSLLDTGGSKDEEPHLNGHSSSLISEVFTSTSTTTSSVSHTAEYTYDKAIAGYKQYAENSAKKRTSSITSLNSNASQKEEEKKEKLRINGRSPSPSKGSKLEEKVSFFSKEVDKESRDSAEPKVIMREKSPKINISQRRSMFENVDLSTVQIDRQQKQINRRSLDIKNKVASFENLESEPAARVRATTPSRETNLRAKVSSFENLSTETNKVRGITPPRDANFQVKLATFTSPDSDTICVKKKTPERDMNFHKKLASFNAFEIEETSREQKIIPQRDSSLKKKIASYEQLEQAAEPRSLSSREESVKSKDRSVSLENLDEPQVDVKMRPARSMMNITRRIPSTPYMEVELDNSRSEKECVEEIQPVVSCKQDSPNVQGPSKRTTVYETFEKCQVSRDVESAPMYSIFQYLSAEVNAQVFEIASKLEETPILGSPINKVPSTMLDAPPSQEEDSMEAAKEYSDADINEVINDYEQVGEMVEDSSDQPENIYENITDEPTYENIYEKVNEDNLESQEPVEEHQYQTLEEVRQEVLPPPPPARIPPSAPSEAPEVLDVTWTDGPSQAAPPSEPPPPPPPDDDSDSDASEQPQSLPVQEEDGFKRENSTRRLKKELWRRRSDFLGTSSHYVEEQAVKPPPDLSDLLRQEREAERSLIGSKMVKTTTQEILSELEIARREREIIENLERSEQMKQQLQQQEQQEQQQQVWENQQGTGETDDHLQYQECLRSNTTSSPSGSPGLIPPPPPSPISEIVQPFAYVAANMPTPSDFIPLSTQPMNETSVSVSPSSLQCTVPEARSQMSLTPIPECDELSKCSSPMATPEVVTLPSNKQNLTPLCGLPACVTNLKTLLPSPVQYDASNHSGGAMTHPSDSAHQLGSSVMTQSDSAKFSDNIGSNGNHLNGKGTSVDFNRIARPWRKEDRKYMPSTISVRGPCEGKKVRFNIAPYEDRQNINKELMSSISDSDCNIAIKRSPRKDGVIAKDPDSFKNFAQISKMHESSSYIIPSPLSSSQVMNPQTASQLDTGPMVAKVVPVTSTNNPENSYSVIETSDIEHDGVDWAHATLESTINTEERHAEVLDKHVANVSSEPQFRITTQTSEVIESQLVTDHYVASSSTLDYSTSSVASSGSQPDEYKKLAELEEEMMRHDKDMLRRAGHLPDTPPPAASRQPSDPYENQEGSTIPPSIDSYKMQRRQPPSHLPIQEFYTAPTYDSTPTMEEDLTPSMEDKGVVLPAGSPSQYTTLASPHPFSRSNSHSSIETNKHLPLQSARSTPLPSPRESIPEPLPRKKKVVSPPVPSKTQRLLPDLNTAERLEAMRVSRMTSSESLMSGGEPMEPQESSSALSGQQMSKQTLLALSAIPKPRLTDNESWIKKKQEGQKRDYSKHWLHQEAEQRRLEQQDRISRPKYTPPLPQRRSPQSASPQFPPQQHPSSHTTSYQPTQNTSPLFSTQSSSYPQSLRNPSPSRNASPVVNNNNNNNSSTTNSSSNSNNTISPLTISSSTTTSNNSNSWRNQATTYQPHIPAPAPAANGDKALPDSIINNLTQRINNKNTKSTYSSSSGRAGSNYTNSNYRDENYHDYMNADALSSPSGPSPLFQTGQPSPPSTQQPEANTQQDQRLLSVSGKKKCSHCSEELGRGAAMIIESLRLFYHIPCFKCCVCGIQLGNGSAGADVRVRNHKLHCHNCYSNDEGMKFSKV